MARWGCLSAALAVGAAAGLVIALAAQHEASTPGDGPGRLACQEFREMVRDADIMTSEQVVARAQSVHDDGQYSTMPGVAAASRDLVAATIAGDRAGVADAITRMSSACAGP